MGYLAEDRLENGQALIQSLHVPAEGVKFTIYIIYICASNQMKFQTSALLSSSEAFFFFPLN